jgi:hypothetical protein
MTTSLVLAGLALQLAAISLTRFTINQGQPTLLPAFSPVTGSYSSSFMFSAKNTNDLVNSISTPPQKTLVLSSSPDSF